MKIKDGQSLLFIGDSITDCGRGHPIGIGENLGDGYVALVDSLLATCYPRERVRVMNTGVSGDCVTDLDRRWDADVLDLKPDWLSVMIGINDVWQQFGNSLAADSVAIDRYERVYRLLLNKTHNRVRGLLLLSPFLLEPNSNDQVRQQMDAYSRVVKGLADDFSAKFVDVQAAFDAYLSHRSANTLSDDRVHPNQTGHMIIALAVLQAIEFDWRPAD